MYLHSILASIHLLLVVHQGLLISKNTTRSKYAMKLRLQSNNLTEYENYSPLMLLNTSKLHLDDRALYLLLIYPIQASKIQQV